MQVSAVSTNFCQEQKTYKISSAVAKKFNDGKNETVFNSIASSKNKSDMAKVYANINEWKDFCHEQILNGKLDIIA